MSTSDQLRYIGHVEVIGFLKKYENGIATIFDKDGIEHEINMLGMPVAYYSQLQSLVDKRVSFSYDNRFVIFFPLKEKELMCNASTPGGIIPDRTYRCLAKRWEKDELIYDKMNECIIVIV